jgi:hypothetical protein
VLPTGSKGPFFLSFPLMECSNYSKAITFADCNNWMTGIQGEMESLEKNDTWDLVKLPKYKKHARCKWIFKRRVFHSISTLLNIVAIHDYELEQLDGKNAFL